ncbi:glycosyltransferase family 2 protein [Mycolicibacterium thermoresistibile]
MPASGAPDWAGAGWIGVVDLDDIDHADGPVRIRPSHADGYRRARLLLRRHGAPLRFVDTDIVDGLITVDATDTEAPPEPPTDTPPISVVLCTRDRPDDLAGALASLAEVDYPDFEVVVVDNAPTTDATDRIVRARTDLQIRRVVEPVAGLSNARNTGLRAAQHRLVAFTDDDVVVDPHWLTALARGFTRSADVACVCGLVPSGELRTPAQAYFDHRVSWSDSLTPRVFTLAAPPQDMPLFPFQVGRFGTGANFAVDRERIIALGGFDEALGAGTATKGGEDLDIFYRVLAAGHALSREPAAIVWHRHRIDTEALLAQARGYGIGLGAWLTKIGLDPVHRRHAWSVVRRRLRSTAKAGAAYGAIAAAPPTEFGAALPRGIGRIEVLSVLSGPRALWRGRREGRHPAPLRHDLRTVR